MCIFGMISIIKNNESRIYGLWNVEKIQSELFAKKSRNLERKKNNFTFTRKELIFHKLENMLNIKSLNPFEIAKTTSKDYLTDFLDFEMCKNHIHIKKKYSRLHSIFSTSKFPSCYLLIFFQTH